MTVAEVIAALQALPQDLDVAVDDCVVGLAVVTGVDQAYAKSEDWKDKLEAERFFVLIS